MISNRPEALHEFDRLQAIINGVADGRLYPAAIKASEAAADITALAFLMLHEGEKPACARYFFEEIAAKKGDSTVKKLVNYALDGVPSQVRRIIVEYKNQMVAAIEVLRLHWVVPPTPTQAMVRAEIDRLGGLDHLRQRWMNILADRAREAAEYQRGRLERVRQQEDEEQAMYLGMTVEQYRAHKAEEEAAVKEARKQARVASILRHSEPVKLSKSFKVPPGAVIVEHDAKLFMLGQQWADEVRAVLRG